MLMPWSEEEILDKPELQKSALGLSPGEGCFCNSDRRTVPRPKLCVSARRLQVQVPQPRKAVMGLSPDEMVSVARKLSAVKERREDQSCLFRWGYGNKGHSSEKSVLGSSSGEDGFCSSEIKHDRRTAPSPRLFVSAMRLQGKRPQPQRIILGTSPGEDCFCSSETKYDRRTAPRPKLFVSTRRLQKQRPNPR
jgi:hypothetical protein